MRIADTEKTSNNPSRRRLLTAIQIFTGISLVLALLCLIDVNAALRQIRSANKVWLGVAFLWTASIYFVRGIVLTLLASTRTRLPIHRVFIFNLIGAFFSNFLPSQFGGDIIKGVYFLRYFSAKHEAFAPIIAQRILGFAATLIISVLSTLLLFPSQQALRLGVIFLAFLAAGSLLLFLTYSFIQKNGTCFLGRIENNRTGSALIRLSRSLLEYREHKLLLAISLIISAGVTILGCLGYCVIGFAVHYRMPVNQALLAGALVQLSAILPISLGGIGVAEGSFIGVCVLMGTAKADALAIAILGRLLTIGVSLLGGLCYLFIPIRIRRNSHPKIQDSTLSVPPH